MNFKESLTRTAPAMLAALLAATVLKYLLVDWAGASAGDDAAQAPGVSGAFSAVFFYALLPAVLAASLTEWLRLRHVAVHAVLGIGIAFFAGYAATRGGASPVSAFAGGALTATALVVTGLLAGLTYWALSGRRAGWRGDQGERAARMSEEAFRSASANAQSEPCRACVAGALALGLFLFTATTWVSIELFGMRDWLVTQSELQGRNALRAAGHAWATFRIEGSRGIVKGTAPDDVQKRAAFETVRDALAPVTGFPGVFAQIENEAVARVPISEMNQQLEDATRREGEAKAAAAAAQIAAQSARAAEAEAKSLAELQSSTAQAEIKRMLEEQARAAEEEIKRKLDEQAQAAEAEIKRRLDEQARIAEEDARKMAADKTADEAAPGADAEAPAAAGAPATTDVAALDQAVVDADAAAPADDRPSPEPSGTCTAQDLAIIESARIHFASQGFEISAAYSDELDRLAASALACTPRPILVSGHASPDADSVFNRALGLQRAEAVRQQLIARGVPETLVVAETEGTNAPIDVSSNAGQRALNRRTEFRLLEAAEMSRDAKLDPEERAAACETELVAIMSQSIIHFPTASSRISADSMGLIKKLANAIQTCGSVIVTVEGHTDKIGDDTYNQGLSEQRANAVREALAVAGADQTRLASRGFAASRPYDPSETAQAFAMNRRIEFKVSGKFSSTSTRGP